MDIESKKILLNNYISFLQQESSEGYQSFSELQGLIELLFNDIELKIISLNDFFYTIVDGDEYPQIHQEDQLIKRLYFDYISGVPILLKDSSVNGYFQINSVQHYDDIYIVNIIGLRLRDGLEDARQVLQLSSFEYNDSLKITKVYNQTIPFTLILKDLKKIMHN